MQQISTFINEVHSVDVSLEKRYLVENMSPLKEEEVPKEARQHLKSKRLYIANVSSENTIRTLYNNARLSLALLSDEQLEKALIILQEYSYKEFYKELSTFYVKATKGEVQPMHEADFMRSLRYRLKNDVPEFGTFTIDFLHDLTDDVSSKKGYMYSLTQDISKLLGEVKKNGEKNNIPPLHISEPLSEKVAQSGEENISLNQALDNIFRIKEYDYTKTAHVLEMINKFTSLNILSYEETQKMDASLYIDKTEREYFTISEKLNDIFNVHYLDGKFDFLERIKSLLVNGLKLWEDIFSMGGVYINLNMEANENLKSHISKDEMKRLAEIKIHYLKPLIELLDSYIIKPTQDSYQQEKSDITESVSLEKEQKRDNHSEAMQAEQNSQQRAKPFEEPTNATTDTKQVLYTPKPPKYKAKQYALAFIYDCLATDVDYMQFDSKKSQLEEIGESRVNGTISGNTFYKAFNEILAARTGLESEEGLIILAGKNWREIIINLSNDQEKVSEYLKEKGL